MGIIFRNKKQFIQSIEFINKSIEINKQFYSNKHPELAGAYLELALIYSDENKKQLAEDYFYKSISIYESTSGSAHPHLARVYYLLSKFYYDNDKVKSKRFLSKAILIYKKKQFKNKLSQKALRLYIRLLKDTSDSYNAKQYSKFLK